MTEVSSSEEAFAAGGPIAECIEGYAPRDSQIELAKAIETALDQKGVLVAEAGTGIGKTFAYLVPAILSGLKVVISTGTKTLQDQLFHRDLPLVRRALKKTCKAALLKGRSNYICLYKLELIDQISHLPASMMALIEKVRRKLNRTHWGETSEFTSIPQDSEVWREITSTVDSCLGQDCPNYQDCYLIKARRRALAATIVVINHHLFFADLLLKEDGGELLPDVDAVIIDEAHQLPALASEFFGNRLGSRQMLDFIRDVEIEQAASAADMPDILTISTQLKNTILLLRDKIMSGEKRGPWQLIKKQAGFSQIKQQVLDGLNDLGQYLQIACERSEGLTKCWQRNSELLQQFSLLTADEVKDQIHWYENFSQSFVIHQTPMRVADQFRRYIKEKPRWIFTSATLSVNNRFAYFTEQLGLDEATFLQLPSPFNYPTQALLYVPRSLPDPNHPDYLSAVAKNMLEIVKCSQGRAFLLVTSHQALQALAKRLESDIEYPLLVQGTLPKDKLLKRFRELGNAVLLGTQSFWEGVDVRGQALSCVVIDRLPFAMPDSPVLQARILAIKKERKQPFMEYQLPEAAITLKQGAGRLIRDVSDYGVLVICDPRIVARDYGKVFLTSLPNMPRTRDLAKVKVFFEKMQEIS